MSDRPIARHIDAMAVSEGAGVVVKRSIGLPILRHLDPFLMLDHFSSDDPDDYIAGFPNHPHRGFVTLTYMLDGHMEHSDSMGNRGDLRAGGAQWMKAASGVIHSEMPRQSNGLMRGFQLWINLPAAQKMSAPEYQEYAARQIPTVDCDGATVRVLCGEFGGTRGPIEDQATRVRYLDIAVPPERTLGIPLAADLAAFAYVFEGAARVADVELPAHQLAVIEPGAAGGDPLEVATGAAGARLILVSGRPLGEPIVQHGPFVMNSREEIEKALEDYRQGRLVRAPGP